MASYWIIEQAGQVVHVATKPIIHPNAREIGLPAGRWVVKTASGEIKDLCDTFPLHPDAYWTPTDDPEVNAFLQRQAERREAARLAEEKSAAERAAADEQQRKRDALLDALIAKGVKPEDILPLINRLSDENAQELGI